MAKTAGCTAALTMRPSPAPSAIRMPNSLNRRRETWAPAEDAQRKSQIYGDDVQQEVSSATRAKEYYPPDWPAER